VGPSTRGGIDLGRDPPLLALPCISRNLAVYESLDGGRDFRMRLADVAFMRLFARDIGGLKLPQFNASDCIEEHCGGTSDALEVGAPIAHSVRSMSGEKTNAECKTLFVRILAPKGFTVWVPGCVFYADWA